MRDIYVSLFILSVAVWTGIGCSDKNDRREFVDTVMKNPDKLDSICANNVLAGTYAAEFLGYEESRQMVIDALRSFKGDYDVMEKNNEMADQPYPDSVQRAHHIILSGPAAQHNVDFQFFTPDGTTWELTNIIIVGGDLR